MSAFIQSKQSASWAASPFDAKKGVLKAISSRFVAGSVLGGALALAVTGCGKKTETERQATPGAAAPSAAVTTAAVSTPAPSAATPAASPPTLPAPRMLAHISPAWGRHGNLPPKLGIAVGQQIPDVAGVDSEGKEWRLRDAAKEHAPLVLAFYRGGFCPFAAYFLRAMAVQTPAFQKSGAQLVFISADAREQVARTKAEHDLKWPMISDPELKIIKAFHLDHRLDDKDAAHAAEYKFELPSADKDGKRPLVSYSGVFVVGADGKVGFAHANTQPDWLLAYSQILNGVEQTRGAPKPTPP